MTNVENQPVTHRGSLAIRYADLAALIRPVLPHVDTPRYYGGDWASSILLETKAGYLTATATDRYTAAMTRFPVQEGTDFKALIDFRQVKALLAMFKPAKAHRGVKDVGPLVLSVEGELLRVRGAGAMFTDASVVYGLTKASFPNVGSVLTRELEDTKDGRIALNATLLAKFASATRDGEPLKVQVHGRMNEVRVSAGDYFIGAIMPVRFAEDQADADWSAVLA